MDTQAKLEIKAALINGGILNKNQVNNLIGEIEEIVRRHVLRQAAQTQRRRAIQKEIENENS